MARSRRTALAASLGALLLAALAASALACTSDDAPPPVAPAEATATHTPTTTAEPTPTVTPTPTATAGPTWPAPPPPHYSTFDAPEGKLTAIAVGSVHACALTEAGEAVCWVPEQPAAVTGDPWYQRSLEWYREVDVPPPGPYVAIDAYGTTTCAVRRSGEIVCWPEPIAPIPEGNFATVSLGERNCALDEQKNATCWSHWGVGTFRGPFVAVNAGDAEPAGDQVGPLGVSADCAVRESDGGIECWRSGSRKSPIVDRDPPPGAFVTVEAGNEHACGLRATGEVVCWGGNYYGQTNVPPDSYVAVSVDEHHTCALTTGGDAVCWGGSYTELAPPDDSLGPYVAISVGGAWPDRPQACALTPGGRAVCWGSRERIVERPIAGSVRYTHVSDGRDHTCALTEEGPAVCWGRNYAGQADAPPGYYVAISAIGAQSCALTPAREVVCWGSGVPGEFGPDGSYAAIAGNCALTRTGVPVCWTPSGSIKEDMPAGPFVAIDSDWRRCALTVAGDPVCWGRDEEPPPGDVGPLQKIAVGGDNLCALTSDWTIACWGGGLLEDTPAGQYVAITVGWHHACALGAFGDVVCWGYNDYGQTDVPPGRYDAVSASATRTCAISKERDIVCWGNVEYEPANTLW